MSELSDYLEELVRRARVSRGGNAPYLELSDDDFKLVSDAKRELKNFVSARKARANLGARSKPVERMTGERKP